MTKVDEQIAALTTRLDNTEAELARVRLLGVPRTPGALELAMRGENDAERIAALKDEIAGFERRELDRSRRDAATREERRADAARRASEDALAERKRLSFSGLDGITYADDITFLRAARAALEQSPDGVLLVAERACMDHGRAHATVGAPVAANVDSTVNRAALAETQVTRDRLHEISLRRGSLSISVLVIAATPAQVADWVGPYVPTKAGSGVSQLEAERGRRFAEVFSATRAPGEVTVVHAASDVRVFVARDAT